MPNHDVPSQHRSTERRRPSPPRRWRTLLTAPIALAALAALVALATPAAAAPPTAADFAADCNADGALSVTGTQRYRHGSATLTRDCFVTMAPAAELVLRDVTLSGSSGGLIVGDAQENTIVVVRNSTIDLGSAVQIAPGCCAGSGEPGRSESDGVARVVDSTLRGTSVEVSGSIAAEDGKAVVRRSTLEATSSLGVLVGSSLSSTGGRTVVRDSSLLGGNVTITTGPTGTCRSTGNTPAVPCT